MLSIDKINAMKRLKEEFISINTNQDPNIGLTIGLQDDENIFRWKIALTGARDTPYRGGLFYLNANFPDNYPKSKPEIVFITPIYHVNVNPHKSNIPGAEPLGHISISTLNFWKPEYKMYEVLGNIFGLFYMANPESPYGLERANEFRFNKELYEEKIKYFTRKYANPATNYLRKEYLESWDFTYP